MSATNSTFLGPKARAPGFFSSIEPFFRSAKAGTASATARSAASGKRCPFMLQSFRGSRDDVHFGPVNIISGKFAHCKREVGKLGYSLKPKARPSPIFHPKPQVGDDFQQDVEG